MATAVMLNAASAEAHFLQTDPVGYKDDMDLYSYVGDDPMNHADPTGMTCTGAGQAAVCQIDQVVEKDGSTRLATKADHAHYAKFEAAYTATVRALYANGGKTATITLQGKGVDGKPLTFTISAASLARGLSNRLMDADPHNVWQNRNAFGIVTSAGVTPEEGGRKTTYAGTGMLYGGTGFQRMAVGHEGIHYSVEEKSRMLFGPPESDDGSSPHQGPYNRASNCLQGNQPC